MNPTQQYSVYRALQLANYQLASANLYVSAPDIDLGAAGTYNSISVARGIIGGAATGLAGMSVEKYLLIGTTYQALDYSLYRFFPKTMGADRKKLKGRVFEVVVGLAGYALAKGLVREDR